MKASSIMVSPSNNIRISINEAPHADNDDNDKRASRLSRLSRLSHFSDISQKKKKNKDEPTTPEALPLAAVLPDNGNLWIDNNHRREASFGTTPLHLASSEGNQDMVKSLLMNAKTEVNSMDGDGWTSLHLAVKGGHLNVVRMLITDPRININAGGGYVGCTPLHLAAKEGHNDILKFILLDSKVNVNAMDKNGSTAFHILTKESCKRFGVDKRYLKCIKSLMEKADLKVNKPDMYGHTALSHAVRNGNKETVRTILQHHGKHRLNLDTSAADEMKTVRESILVLFPEFKSMLPPPLMESLESSSSQTRLLAAIQHDCLDVFRDVLKKSSVNIEHWYDEPYYCTCLELACTLEGRHQFTRILVDSGANVNTVNPVSDVPLLHMAAKRGNLEQLNVLLSTDRIDLNIKDCCQRTALHCLARLSVTRQEEVQGLQQSLALILEGECSTSRMIDLDATDEWGNTALHVASRCGNSEMVDILLRNGASINAMDGCGETALHIAARDGNQDTVVTLLKHGADLMFTKFRQPPLAQIDRGTLRRFFDECLETNDKAPQHQDFRLTFNYNFLAPSSSNKDKKPGSEMPLLLYISQDRRLRHMLKHPIITSFLYLKWSHARIFFYFNLLFCAIFLGFLTAHVILTDFSNPRNSTEPSVMCMDSCRKICIEYSPANYSASRIKRHIADEIGEMAIENILTVEPEIAATESEILESSFTEHSTVFVSGSTTERLFPTTEDSDQLTTEQLPIRQENVSNTNFDANLEKNAGRGFVRIVLTVLVIIFAMREIMQLLSATKQYVRRLKPLLRIAIIIPTIILCLDVFDNEVNHHCASIAILLAWFEFLLTIGCLPSLSIPLQMLQTVSITFIKFMSFYCPLIIAFSLCFFVMFRSCTKDPFYKNIGMSILHSFLMFIGEYEASDIEFEQLNVTSHIVLVVFILLMGVILLNLLSGLAVSDTQAIKNDAETLSLIARVRLIANIENLVLGAADSKLILPRAIRIFTPSLCSVFKCYPEKQVHVFPNRTKGNIYLDDTEPRMNTAMSRETIKIAMKHLVKKNVPPSTKTTEAVQGAVIRAWGSDGGALVSMRVKDLCEQQELLVNQVRELKDMYECKMTRVEEEIKTALEGVAGEVGNRYDLLSAKQEKLGNDIAERKSDMREVLRCSQSGLQEELMNQSGRIQLVENKLSSLEKSINSTSETVQQIFSLLVLQQRKQ
ncbi:hypothetical protein C0J52_03241 [Blattella germanica]|nr:hypothetical protein C0J52_03241 [Blattella germanica]